jgi:hypothetical protein
MAYHIFHGGCHGCTQQELNGVKFCMGCCYFEANWKLPSLSNRPPTAAEIMRNKLKKNQHADQLIDALRR